MKKIALFLLLSVLIGCASKNENWLEGKTFAVKSTYVSNNPEEGGPNYLKIKAINSGEIKIGDIIDYTTNTVKNDSLFVKGNATQHTYIFVIKENKFLVDEYGNKWEYE